MHRSAGGSGLLLVGVGWIFEALFGFAVALAALAAVIVEKPEAVGTALALGLRPGAGLAGAHDQSFGSSVGVATASATRPAGVIE